jgi:hypothetical protein
MSEKALKTVEPIESVGARSPSDAKAQKAPANARTAVFAGLVQAEDDTVGLLAYALYKQNKRDWLTSFYKDQERDVTQGELLAYHLGEIQPRRLQTYRRLAVDVLAKDPGARDGEGFVGHASWAAAPGADGKAAKTPSLSEVVLARGWLTSLIGGLAVIGAITVVVLALALINPAIIHDILPGQPSAQAAPAK